MILRKLLTMTVWLLMTISLPAKTVSPLMSKIFGHVTDNQGRSIAGVVVSDGYRCVTTNRNGIYRLNRHTGAKFVFYTNPKGYEPDSKGFFQPLSKDKQEYNFVLGQHTGNDTHYGRDPGRSPAESEAVCSEVICRNACTIEDEVRSNAAEYDRAACRDPCGEVELS